MQHAQKVTPKKKASMKGVSLMNMTDNESTKTFFTKITWKTYSPTFIYVIMEPY